MRIGSQRAQQDLTASDAELVDSGLTQLGDAFDHSVSKCVEHVVAQIYWGRTQVALLFAGVGVQDRDE